MISFGDIMVNNDRHPPARRIQVPAPWSTYVYTWTHLPTGKTGMREYAGTRLAFLASLARWNGQSPGVWNFREGPNV